MERNLIQTVACFSGLGLCAAFAGCQTAEKNDYYQPTSRHGSQVQQVPQAYPTAPSGSGYSSPSNSGPTLIAPPGQSSGPPMAPPAVPGVAPYGSSSGPLPVPAPTSWVPGPQNNMVFVGYTQPQMAFPQADFVSLHNGLIAPNEGALSIQQVDGKENGVSWTPIRRGVNRVLRRNADGTAHQSELGFPAPGAATVTQNRQLPSSGQALERPVFVPSLERRSQFTPETPWTVNNNPVSISALVLPQEVVPTQPVLEQHVARLAPRPILVSPSVDETHEAWPNKLSEDELETELKVAENRSFSVDELPLIQPEIRHRLSKSNVTARPVPVPARMATAVEDESSAGPLLLRQ